MRTRVNMFDQLVPAAVWRMRRDAFLALLDDTVWPTRYAPRRSWVEEHVAPLDATYMRILLRNTRSWPSDDPSEPEFCWRLEALVHTDHRGRCKFLFDVFDATFDAAQKRRAWRRPSGLESTGLLAAGDLS